MSQSTIRPQASPEAIYLKKIIFNYKFFLYIYIFNLNIFFIILFFFYQSYGEKVTILIVSQCYPFKQACKLCLFYFFLQRISQKDFLLLMKFLKFQTLIEKLSSIEEQTGTFIFGIFEGISFALQVRKYYPLLEI